MKISFRQGIVRHQTNLSAPDFLRKSNQSPTAVDLIISPEPTVVTFAHGAANYLIEETQSILGAWGTGAVGSANGPLTAVGQTQYLYWDISLATGELTRGWTTVKPIVNPLEPLNPENDLHWFDSQMFKIFVYAKMNPQDPASPGHWLEKVRVFAGEYNSSATLIPYGIGSQVDISGGSYSSGNLILGSNNKPLRQSDGTFVTTESPLIIYQTGGQNVQFDSALVFAQADEEIPKFSCVSFKPNRTIGLASSNNIYSFVSGIVVEDLFQQEVGQIISNGIVRNEQWNFTAEQINKPLFCGVSGEVLLTPPIVGVVQQIGYVYDADSIYFNLFPPVRIR